MQPGTAAKTSRTECCFKNTVDIEIKIVTAPKIIRHPGV